MYRGTAEGYALFDDVGIAIFEPYSLSVNSANAFDGSHITQTGHHNDCFLASDTDFGTYTSGAIEDEKKYIEEETKYTVMGGETCALNSPRSDCTVATNELARFHYSYLNQDYNLDVLNSWVNGGCMDEVTSHLGYRLVITSAMVSPVEFIPGGDVSYSISIENRGNAAPIHHHLFRLVFVSTHSVTGQVTQECSMVDSSVDIRTWYASGTAIYTITGMARLPNNIPDGLYDVYLDLADAHEDLKNNPHFKIGVANDKLFNTTTGLNDLKLSINIDSSNAGLAVGTSQAYNAVVCNVGTASPRGKAFDHEMVINFSKCAT